LSGEDYQTDSRAGEGERAGE